MKEIVVELKGGVGNQLFQYAAGRALALRTGAGLALDLRHLLRQGKRAYGLGDFRLGPGVRLLDGGSGIGWLVRRLGGGPTVFREAGFAYDARVRSLTGPVRLEGYFQSERYFAEEAATIRADLTPGEEQAARLEGLARRLLPSGPKISLHVRRTDYTEPAVAAIHGLLDGDYYARALGRTAERVGPACVCVFTDDPAWVRANLALPADAVMVSEHTRSATDDLMLMSRCDHHITANSTFSWWGAWLNRRDDKLVVTPDRWFRPAAGMDTRDLRPAGWLRV